jgi:hypothetical protein
MMVGQSATNEGSTYRSTGPGSQRPLTLRIRRRDGCGTVAWEEPRTIMARVTWDPWVATSHSSWTLHGRTIARIRTFEVLRPFTLWIVATCHAWRFTPRGAQCTERIGSLYRCNDRGISKDYIKRQRKGCAWRNHPTCWQTGPMKGLEAPLARICWSLEASWLTTRGRSWTRWSRAMGTTRRARQRSLARASRVPRPSRRVAWAQEACYRAHWQAWGAERRTSNEPSRLIHSRLG